jgi:hypothetical protein
MFGRHDLGEGPLVNQTDGGEGSGRYVASSETLEKRRLSMLGKNRRPKPEYLKILARIQQTGRKWTPEQHEKHKRIKTGKTKRQPKGIGGTKVCCNETGIEYVSISDASKQCNVPYSTLRNHLYTPNICKNVRGFTFKISENNSI